MNHIKIGLVTFILIASITGVLFYNKSQMAAKSRTDVLTAIPVTVVEVGKTNLTDTRSFMGTVEANNDVAIISETEGKVTAVLAKVGDFKPAGSVLIRVDDELTKAAYATA